MNYTKENGQEMNPMSMEIFVRKQLELLDIERNAEIEENKCLQESVSVKTLQKKGVCIAKLHLSNVATGLYGRPLLSFQTYSNSPLPAHSISSGDIIGIGNVNSDGCIEVITSGIVFRVSDCIITVAFEKNSDSSDIEREESYVIIKLANDVTYKRLKRALKHLENKGGESHLVSVLFGEKTPSTIESSLLDSIVFFNERLNDVQKEAVKFSLSQKEVSILHGPPGTGKTTTVVECILQAVSQKMKVLACAPSNVAVDNLVEKLSRYKVKMVRLGHPARFLSSIQPYSLDAIVSQYDGSDVVDEMHKEIDELRKRIEKTRGSGARKSLWAENKTLLKEVKEREKTIVKNVLKNVDVVLCTLTSASDDGPLKHLEKDHFDVCFIDECSQALEASCWIPLMRVRKCVLAGDHNQLPPTIISKKAAKDGFAVTLMERLLKLHGDSVKKMLTVQYRMHADIMQWPSAQLYDSKLIAHATVCSHLLKGLPNTQSNENTTIPLLLIDTAGCDLYELEAEAEESKGNEGEADLVALHVKNLINAGISGSEIAVITPYNLQVDLIKSRLSKSHPKLEVKSVDGFQGREKEAVILSLVRSNDVGEVGFLAEERRINVAITRAKRHLAVICNSETVSHNDFLKSFMEYCAEKAEVRTAFEYEGEIGKYPLCRKTRESTHRRKEGHFAKKKSDGRNRSFVGTTPEEAEKLKQKRERERLAVEEKYGHIIDEFVKSQKVCLSFPLSLTAFERRAVHEVSEKLGLIHISSGEGTARCIEIRKYLTTASNTKSTDNLNPKDKTKDAKSVILHDCCSGESDRIINTGEENPILDARQTVENQEAADSKPATASIARDTLHTQAQIKQTVDANTKQTSKKEKTTKSKPKLKTLKIEESTDTSEDNFDDLIQQVMKADKTCFYGNCKKCVAVLAQICRYCNGRFCFSHFIPEAHGCGDAAKAHARSQIRKDGVLYAGSGKPEKKVDPIKHSYLQKKLDKKLNELSSQRKSKPKS